MKMVYFMELDHVTFLFYFVLVSTSYILTETWFSHPWFYVFIRKYLAQFWILSLSVCFKTFLEVSFLGYQLNVIQNTASSPLRTTLGLTPWYYNFFKNSHPIKLLSSEFQAFLALCSLLFSRNLQESSWGLLKPPFLLSFLPCCVLLHKFQSHH